jgi:hypothetical protein
MPENEAPKPVMSTPVPLSNQVVTLSSAAVSPEVLKRYASPKPLRRPERRPKK